MTITVSISDFRENLSDYLEKVSRGNTIIIKDKKKGKSIAQLTPTQKWDPVAYGRILKKLRDAPVFTAEAHPEWATLKDIQKWLRQTRKSSDRDFGHIK